MKYFFDIYDLYIHIMNKYFSCNFAHNTILYVHVNSILQYSMEHNSMNENS